MLIPRSQVGSDYPLQLPSAGLFYPGKQKSITCSVLTVDNVYELYAADLEKDPYNKERLIVNTLGKCIKDFDIFDLTVGDYKFFYYWIKLNSYKKAPVVVTWTDGDKSIVSTVKSTDFVISELNPHKTYDKQFGYKTVRDSLSILEYQKNEDKYIGEFASYLSGKSLEEKVTKLKSSPVDLLIDIKKHKEEFYHNIEEVAEVKDTENPDAKAYRLTVSINLSDFFPEI